ncbi:MAG: polysaccharide biosynthesis/export family protein [Pseudomonadota bacterium]
MLQRQVLAAMCTLLASACAISPEESEAFPQQAWLTETERDPAYLLASGDRLELTVYSAPELSREAVVNPDGRLRLPLIDPIPASGRTPEAVEADVRAAYGVQLVRPDLDLLVTEFSSQQVFVGGAVARPGLFDLPGQIDPLQALILAGGRTDVAKTGDVFVMRRLPGGEVKTAVFDIDKGLRDPRLATWGPLQRFDVVYVPQSAIANQNRFVQQYVRNALPIQFSLFYDVSGRNN